jgi:antitoxin component of RelBE/YafQ-DinJ toxin-antitoxin module
MPPTTTFRARVLRTPYSKAKKIFQGVGLTPAQAVNIFFSQVAIRQEIPFRIGVNDAPYEYPEKEYGVSPGKVDAFEARMDAEIARGRKKGKLADLEDFS